MPTVIAVFEKSDNRRAGLTLDKYRRTYDRHFLVECDTGNIDWSTITASGSLPVVGTDAYPTDSGALCVSWDGTQRTGKEQKFFDLTYRYDSEVPVSQLRNQDPLSRGAVWKLDYLRFQKPVYKDQSGNAILNSANQPFENVIEIDAVWPIIVIEKNYSTFSINDIITLNNSINDADWTFSIPTGGTITIPKWQGKMEPITLEEKEENLTNYYAYTYRILVNPDELFKPYKILDCGYAQLDGTDTHLVAITDKFGKDISKPFPLDGNGHAMVLPIAAGTETYLSFNIYKQASWAGIP